jgi:5-methylcytosine-specific restriction endonuclease McrA
MLKLDRPLEARNFDRATQSTRAKVAASVAKGGTVSYPNLWSPYKAAFIEAQFGKCAYCEGQVWGLQYGDVEHIQPKAEVHTLEDNPEQWGVEEPWSSSVKGRKAKATIIKPGYWWRAYCWDNYLISCQVCNQQWKANFYPVDGEHVIAPTTGMGKPLLLSPFDEDFDPASHFSFGRLGEICGLSEEGKATISTCGLDRASLRLARYKIARVTHEHLDEIARNVTQRDVLRVLSCIAQDGEARHPHSGMVRVIFVQRTGLTWDQLDQLILRLRTSANADQSLCDC